MLEIGGNDKGVIHQSKIHSSSTPDIIHELMMRPDELATDIGSIIEGREAVEYGIIDYVGGLSDALAALREMKE